MLHHNWSTEPGTTSSSTAPLPSRLDKPLDVGNGLVIASVARGGTWLSLGSAHTDLGYVELSNLPRFDESWRGDAHAVRRYRLWMTDERCPFLQCAPVEREPIEAERYDLIDGAHPFCGMVFGSYTHEVTTWAAERRPAIRQHHLLRAADRSAGALSFRLRFRGWLGRPALGEISEAGVLPDTYVAPALEARDEELIVGAPSLPATAVIRVTVAGATPPRWEAESDGARLTVVWDREANPEATIDISCSLREHVPNDHASEDREIVRVDALSRIELAPAEGTPLVMPDPVRPGFEWLTFRALSYTLRCTALETAPGEICLLTDHRLLPLSWTRDAYYQALLLLTAKPRDGIEVVDAHLRWLWTRCERINGAWMRSHLPNGKIKDARFQLDQQLYPMLELCDYWRTSSGLPALATTGGRGRESEWGELIAQAWRAVPAGSKLGFAATEENPADDPTAMPYVLSSEILRWYTAIRLAELQRHLDLPLVEDLADVAAGLRQSIEQHFACEGPFGRQWAYAIDGKGGSMLYNDANDLPTAFAPMWGFCGPADPVWRATMRFTFSRQNAGFSPGRFGGLGSLHTPGTWPLGDVQEWVSWSLMKDVRRAQRPLTRLLAATTADGMLPETYDSATGVLGARHWFAWPGALVGTLYLMATGARSPWTALS